MAGDKLRESQLPENFAEYRKKVSRFLRYLAKNNYEVKKRQRPGFTKKANLLIRRHRFLLLTRNLTILQSGCFLLTGIRFTCLPKLTRFRECW